MSRRISVFIIGLFLLTFPGVTEGAIIVPPSTCDSLYSTRTRGLGIRLASEPVYKNELLEATFILGTSVDHEREIYFFANILNSLNCAGFATSSTDQLILPPNTNSFTLRFVTEKSFKLFDAQTQTEIDCAICSLSWFQDNGGPYKVNFSGTIPENGNYLETKVYETRSESLVNPVLIMPGMMGTELFEGEEKLWPDTTRMLLTPNDRFMDELAFNVNLQPISNSVTLGQVIREEPTFDYTKGLIEALQSEGYVPGTTLFTFPYDWRKDIRDIAEENLTGQIDYIVDQLGNEKVDIIAHSTGGLVLKQLLLTHPEYEDKIGKVIFVGTPHLGALKAVKAVLYGDTMGVEFLSLGLDPEALKRIGQNFPSIYQLMPSETFFNYQAWYYANYSNGQVFPYDSYEETQAALSEQMNASLLEDARQFHSPELDNFDFTGSGIQAYNIAGCEAPTILGIAVRSGGHYYLVWGEGDKTVPLNSGAHIFGAEKYYALGANHGRMMTEDVTRDLIIDLLVHGEQTKVMPNIVRARGQCVMSGQSVSVHSPVDVHVYMPDGSHFGPTSTGGFDAQIPGIGYTTVEDQKFIFIPSSCADCKVTLDGTGEGTFDAYIQDYEEGKVDRTYYFNKLEVNTNLQGVVNLDLSHLEIDQNGDGVIDSTVMPTSVVEEEVAEDFTPPVTSLVLSGVEGAPGFYRSNVNIALNATDLHENMPSSGVLNINYKIDGGDFLNYTSPVDVTTEGLHTVSYFATDNLGNIEAVKTTSFTIDKTSPEATISFNHLAKDLLITGQDNISLPNKLLVTELPGLTKLTDEAGNVTELSFTDKDRKKSLKAEMASLSYNAINQDISKNKFKYSWGAKNGVLNKLEAELKSKGEFKLDCTYKDVPAETKCKGKDMAGKVRETQLGLVLPVVRTKQGSVEWLWP